MGWPVTADIRDVPRRMTADEYHRLIETGMFGGLRVELRDGEVSPMSPMNPAHASALTRISRLFNALFDEKSASIRLQCPVALDEEWEPHPDLVVAIPEEWEHAHPRAADIHLIIEVSDSSVREDLVRKIPRYAKTGVAEVWVIDLTAEIVHVHRSPDPTGHYLTEFDAKIGDELSIVAFPGSTVPATRLFPMSRANKPAKR